MSRMSKRLPFVFSRKKKNERWATIQRRKRQREMLIDVVSGILILPMFYILTVLVFSL